MMMNSIGHVASCVARLCVATLVLTGCAVDGERQGQGNSVGSGESYSPARERVRSGFAEMVLTDRIWPSFEQASANRIALVTDGSPIYAHIRATRPIGELAMPGHSGGRYRFSAYPHLYLHVGDNESLRSLSTCYVTLAPEEMRLRELVVPLAPLAFRPGANATDCWLTAAASAGYGRRTYEIRLAGFTGPPDTWLPVADLLAVATVPADFTGGLSLYANALQAANEPEPAAAPEAGPVGARLWSASEPTSGSGSGSGSGSANASASGSRTVATVRVGMAESAPAVGRTTAAAIGPIAGLEGGEVPLDSRRIDASAGSGTPALAPEPKASPAQHPVRIVIHHRAGDAAADARARRLQAALASQREFNVEIRSTSLLVSYDNMRIFFDSDREEADRTRHLVAMGPVPIMDFSDFRPLPTPGTIEIWLAETQAARARPETRSEAPEMQATASPSRAMEPPSRATDPPSRATEPPSRATDPPSRAAESARAVAPLSQPAAAMPATASERRKDAPVRQPAETAGAGIEELRLLLLQPSNPKAGARK